MLITLSLVTAAVLITAALMWRVEKKSKFEIVVPLTEQEFDLWTRWIRTKNLTLDVWARKILEQKIPPDVESRMSAANVEAAFAILDQEDRVLGMKGEPELPPELMFKPWEHEHPCLHLSPDPPEFFRKNECQGSCNAPDRLGRACQWPAQIAHTCPVYLARVRKKPSQA
jgi:hypothetical protein